MRQLTIFDFIEKPSDIETTPAETIKQIIEEALGVEFKWNSYCQIYETKINKITAAFHISRYYAGSEDVLDHEAKGAYFIGVDVSDNSGGVGCPCDSIDEAINVFKRNIHRLNEERERK